MPVVFVILTNSLVCRQTSELVKAKVSDRMYETYQLYVDELSKVLRLLLMLASRLARADNALAITKHDSTNHKVIVSLRIKTLSRRKSLLRITIWASCFCIMFQ